MKYILLSFIFGISILFLFIILLAIAIIFGIFVPGCHLIESFGNFQPYFWTNIKLIPFIQSNYSDSSYTRENLLKEQLPTSPNTLYFGISKQDKNTVHKYILNQLLKKIVLYNTRQFTILDIDYPDDYQVLKDLNDNAIQYGLVSTPILYDYLIVHNQAHNTKIQFITTLTHQYVYGITMANRKIYNINDAKGRKVGITNNIATDRIVGRDMMEGIDCQIYECKYENMLERLKDGLIDMYFVIGGFPDDGIRWLLNKNPRTRLVDLEKKTPTSKAFNDKYEKVLINQKRLEYYQKDVYTTDGESRYLPLSNPVGTYNDYFPYINGYKFITCLLTNSGNEVKGNYQVIRDIYHKMYNNRRVGLGYLPNIFLQRNLQLGITKLPIPIHPDVLDFDDRIANDQLNI